MEYGLFVCNRVLIGLDLLRNYYGDWERGFSAGPVVRYYPLTGSRFSLYSEAKYICGHTKYKNKNKISEWDVNTNVLNLNIGIGFNWFYKKRFSMEIFAGYQYNNLFINDHPTLGEYYFSRNDIGYGLQISYHFKRYKRIRNK